MEPEPPTPSSPGWHPDPGDPEHLQRLWDGARWTEATRPRPTPVSGPSRPVRVAMLVLTVPLVPAVLVGFVSLLLLGVPTEPGPSAPEGAVSPFEFAMFGVGLATPAICALVGAWGAKRASGFRRLSALCAALVLCTLWLVLWRTRGWF